MELFIQLFIVSLLTSILNFAFFYRKSESGTMDVTWDAEKKAWMANLHISETANFANKKKLILKINHK